MCACACACVCMCACDEGLGHTAQLTWTFVFRTRHTAGFALNMFISEHMLNIIIQTYLNVLTGTDTLLGSSYFKIVFWKGSTLKGKNLLLSF